MAPEAMAALSGPRVLIPTINSAPRLRAARPEPHLAVLAVMVQVVRTRCLAQVVGAELTATLQTRMAVPEERAAVVMGAGRKLQQVAAAALAAMALS